MTADTDILLGCNTDFFISDQRQEAEKEEGEQPVGSPPEETEVTVQGERGKMKLV